MKTSQQLRYMVPACCICNGWMSKKEYYSPYITCRSCGFTRKDKKSMADIDWNDLKSQVSEHFTVHECLWLPTWQRHATEADGLNDEIKNNLVNLCFIMEKVRGLIGFPISVHCTYRPPGYSRLVGGTETDVHTLGMGMDWDASSNISCDDAKKLLLPHLEELNIRLEDNGPGALWLHTDIHPVIHQRFFKP